MPKRLIISLEYPPQIGGIATYAYNFAAHLPPEETMVYAPKVKGGEDFDKTNPWTVLRLRPYFLFFWPRWLKLLVQTWSIVTQQKITEIHVHQVLPVGYIAYILKKFRKIPYTLFLHGTDIEFANRVTKRKKFAKVCRAADRIVVNSEFLKSKLESKVNGLTNVGILYPCPGDAFFNPVDPEHIRKLKSELGLDGKTVLLSVSRLVEAKGLPHIARMMPELIKLVPNLVWVVVGSGPKLAVLGEIIQGNKMESSVRFAGAINHATLPVYYQSADVFALLTHPDKETEEGWGTAFLEAAASGLPVVAGKVGGVEEAVNDSVTGFVVDVYQQNAAYEALSYLLGNLDAAAEMGARAKTQALNKFTWGQQIKTFLNV